MSTTVQDRATAKTSNTDKLGRKAVPDEHGVILSEAPADRIETTTCYMCACRCGIKVYLKDGKVRYSYNFLGMEEQTLDAELPEPGAHVFGVEFTKEGQDDTFSPTGTMKLYVDDEPVAESPMRTMLIQYSLCGEGLCVGYDGGDAVSSLYEGSRFPFTGGEIHKVMFDLADDQYLDVERELAALLARD